MPLHFPGSDVTTFETLSGPTGLLASPPAGRATALDAPGSDLYAVGGKWGGSLGEISAWTSLPTAGIADGTIASVPRFCGNGRFQAVFYTAWTVAPGQFYVLDSGAGYDLTATDTNPVVVAYYDIPSGVVNPGEEHVADHYAWNRGVYVSGTDTSNIYIGSATNIIASQASITAINRSSRGMGTFWVQGGLGKRNVNANALAYTNAVVNTFAINLANGFTAYAALAGGAATHTMKLQRWSLGRFR